MKEGIARYAFVIQKRPLPGRNCACGGHDEKEKTIYENQQNKDDKSPADGGAI